MSILEPTSPPHGVRSRAALLLAAVFVAGGIAGAAIDRIVVTRNTGTPAIAVAYMPKGSDARPGPTAVDIPYAFQQLGLTDDERVRVRAIVQRMRPQSDSLWDQVRTEVLPKSRSLETRMFQDILCVLTPAQRERWRSNVVRGGFDTAVVNERLRPVREGRCPAAP